MRALQALALNCVKSSDEQRDRVKPGEYKVDFVAHVEGTVSVANSHEAEIVAAIPWQKMVAVLLDKVNGVTVHQVVRQALRGDIDDEELKVAAGRAMRRLKKSTKGIRRGAVTSDLRVTTYRTPE